MNNDNIQLGEIIEAPTIPKHFKISRGQKIDFLILSPIILILLVAGVCKAYDMALQAHLEDSLKLSAQSVHSAYNACEADRQVYLTWKSDNNIVATGIDVCRTF